MSDIAIGRNLCILLGVIDETPQTKDSKGLAVTEFTLVVREEWTDKSGQGREQINRIPCVCFGPRGKVIADYVRAGDQFSVQGSIQINEDDGTAFVKVSDFTLLKGDRGGGERTERSGRGGSASNPRTRDPVF